MRTRSPRGCRARSKPEATASMRVCASSRARSRAASTALPIQAPAAGAPGSSRKAARTAHRFADGVTCGPAQLIPDGRAGTRGVVSEHLFAQMRSQGVSSNALKGGSSPLAATPSEAAPGLEECGQVRCRLSVRDVLLVAGVEPLDSDGGGMERGASPCVCHGPAGGGLVPIEGRPHASSAHATGIEQR